MSVYRRGSSLYYDFRFGGRRYRQSLGPVSLATARQIERQKRVEVAEGRWRPAPPAVITFAELCERYLRWWEPSHRPHSVRLANVALTRACDTLGRQPLGAITGETLAHLQADWLRQGLSPSSCNTYLKRVRHVLRTAGRWGLLPAAVPPVAMLRHAQPQRRVIRPDEEDRLLASLPGALRPMIVFALHTGLRYQELLDLRWKDLDFARGVVTIGADRTKSQRSREVPLNRTARAALDRVVMAGRDGRVFGYRAMRTSFTRARDRAGLDAAITPHSCRHTFATRAIEAGVDLPTLQKWLGHASIAMTAVYTHTSRAHEHAAIRRLDVATECTTAEGAGR